VHIKHRKTASILTNAAVVFCFAAASQAGGEGPIESMSARLRLLNAYPTTIGKIENNEIVFLNGKRMAYDDGKGVKPFDEWLAAPDVEDMFSIQYAPGELAAPPSKNFDPGRARNAEFFRTMYGDCRTGGVAENMTKVLWLPKKARELIQFSRINGAAARLEAVSRELDELPQKFDIYLSPSAGSYNCRVVAGTNTYSAHSYGIAIDIALKHAHYWRWTKTAKGARIDYKNEIPFEIVRIFEKHGFIWGGKWYHYDTMHFEYRPELLPPEAPLEPAATAPNLAR
jgi:D-alanyl-D-alanine carboxypeptidase